MARLGITYFDAVIRANADAYLTLLETDDDVKNLLCEVALEKNWLADDYEGELDERLKQAVINLLSR